MRDTQELLDARELFTDLNNQPYKMFSDEHLIRILQSYKNAPVGEFNQAEIDDLQTLNSRYKSSIAWITEEGIESPKGVLNFGSCSLGVNTTIKKQIKNVLQVTPLRITEFLFDTNARISTTIPVSAVKPGETKTVSFVWKPLLQGRKTLDCGTLVLMEPIFSKRVEWAMANG